MPGILLILAIAVSSAQVPDRVFPIEPGDGAVLGPRPVFHLGYEGGGESAAGPRRFRLRIKLSGEYGDQFFDDRRRRSEWLDGGPGRVIYRPRRPLADGAYHWRAELWNGVEWLAGGKARELRIDSVPPEDVGPLRLAVDPEGRRVVLDWDPVTLDQEGRPEWVARYHVYRYDRLALFRSFEPHEIGTSEIARFIDEGPWPDGARLLFYRVTAEDRAGNEPGRDPR